MAQTISLIPGDGIGPEVTRPRSRDLGGTATTTAFTDAVCAML